MTYSVEIINLVIANLIAKQKITNISKILNISITTINKFKYQYKEYIQNNTFIVDIISTRIHGLNKKNKYINIIKDYVDTNKGCSLNNIVIEATKNNLSNAIVLTDIKRK